DHHEGKLLPDVDDDDRAKHSILVIEQDKVPFDHSPIFKNAADEAVIAVEHPSPDIRSRDSRDDPWNQQNRAEYPSPKELLVQNKRGTESQNECPPCRADRPDKRIPGCLPEKVVSQYRPESIQAHPVVDSSSPISVLK